MKKAKYKTVEKRKFIRLDIPLQVTLKVLTGEPVPGGELSPIKVKSRNISEKGMCLETSQIVINIVNMLSGSPGARENILSLDIELAQGEEPVRATGEVCWYDVDRDMEDFRYQVGIVFIDMDDSGRQKLKAFLKELKLKNNDGFFQKMISLLKG